jgi:hypothetical protein
MSATIEIMGGLGNQLFQIFALISYSINSKKKFYFEDKPITCGMRTKKYWDTPLLQNLKKYIKGPVHIERHYEEPFFHYLPIPDLASYANIKLNGYFQSEKYFFENKETIIKMIDLDASQTFIKEKIAGINAEINGGFFNFENTLSLHFRIGDYAAKQLYHPLTPIEYYEKALDSFCLNGFADKWNVLYFCEEDDIEHVNEQIHLLQAKFPNLVFIKAPIFDDWEQMLLMSLCHHHIIANSTFSWWGAYFGINKNKKVYYPSKWFGPALSYNDLKDLIPDERWILI